MAKDVSRAQVFGKGCFEFFADDRRIVPGTVRSLIEQLPVPSYSGRKRGIPSADEKKQDSRDTAVECMERRRHCTEFYRIGLGQSKFVCKCAYRVASSSRSSISSVIRPSRSAHPFKTAVLPQFPFERTIVVEIYQIEPMIEKPTLRTTSLQSRPVANRYE